MQWFAPSALARANLSSQEEVIMTLAPSAFAIFKPKIETPPVPKSKIDSPAFTWPTVTNACQAVVAAHAYSPVR